MRYTPLGLSDWTSAAFQLFDLLSGTIKFLATLAAPFEWFFLKTPKDGAQCPLYLALSPKVDGVSGKYFSCVSLIHR
jgi:hypothetical protein